MTGDLTADEICSLLQLEPNATCGLCGDVWQQTADRGGRLASALRGSAPLGSALYFLVTPGAPVRLHRIRNDQLYHYYLGDPLEVFLLHADGTTERSSSDQTCAAASRCSCSSGNTFHTARLSGQGRWFLGASSEWPGVIPADVEIGNLDELAGKYPAVAAELSAIAASVEPDTSVDRE